MHEQHLHPVNKDGKNETKINSLTFFFSLPLVFLTPDFFWLDKKGNNYWIGYSINYYIDCCFDGHTRADLIISASLVGSKLHFHTRFQMKNYQDFCIIVSFYVLEELPTKRSFEVLGTHGCTLSWRVYR